MHARTVRGHVRTYVRTHARTHVRTHARTYACAHVRSAFIKFTTHMGPPWFGSVRFVVRAVQFARFVCGSCGSVRAVCTVAWRFAPGQFVRFARFVRFGLCSLAVRFLRFDSVRVHPKQISYSRTLPVRRNSYGFVHDAMHRVTMLTTGCPSQSVFSVGFLWCSPCS